MIAKSTFRRSVLFLSFGVGGAALSACGEQSVPKAASPHSAATGSLGGRAATPPAAPSPMKPGFAMVADYGNSERFGKINLLRWPSSGHFQKNMGGRPEVDVYVSKAGLSSYLKDGAEIPTGTVVVKAQYKPGTNERVDEFLMVMIKQAKGSAEKTGDWWYAIGGPDGKVVNEDQDKLKRACHNCHENYPQALGRGMAGGMKDGEPHNTVTFWEDHDSTLQARAALRRSTELLKASTVTWSNRPKCFSCHHSSLAQLGFSVMKEAGIVGDTSFLGAVDQGIARYLKHTDEKATAFIAAAKKPNGLVGFADPMERVMPEPIHGTGYLLFGMAAAKYPRDVLSDNQARYLAYRQREDGRWPLLENRAPMESSELTATALGIHAMASFGPSDVDPAKRIAKARAFLLSARPRTNEDFAFRLLGLRWSETSGSAQEKKERQGAIDALVAEQLDDGSFAQLPGMPGDSYATGQAVYALYEGGGVPANDPACTRAVHQLLRAQRLDGSWFVKKRAGQEQVFVDSGFPYEKDGFISYMGTMWASIALSTWLSPGAGLTKGVLLPKR